MVTTQPEGTTGSVAIDNDSGSALGKLKQLGSGLMTATGNGNIKNYTKNIIYSTEKNFFFFFL